MSASLERPRANFVQPGPDQRMPTLDEAVDMVLMIAGADRVLDPTETRTIQRMLSGLQAISANKAPMAQGMGEPDMDDSNTQEYGTSGEPTETANNFTLPPGVQYAGSGY